jgi:hypothetical protein
VTPGLVAVAVGCVITTSDVAITPTPTGWLETIRLEVASTGGCDGVTVHLPADVHLREREARLRLGDGTRRKVDAQRWEVLPRGLDDRGAVRLSLPELVSGDRVALTVSREWTTDQPFPWRPGRDGALCAPAAAAGDAAARAPVPATVARDGAWVSAPGPDAGALVARRGAPPEVPDPLDVPLPDGPVEVRVERRVTLDIPLGDAQAALWPGGGAVQRTSEVWTFPPSASTRPVLVPLPPSHGPVDVAVEPADGSSGVRAREDAVVIVAAPSEEQLRVRLAWDAPDPPACGEVPSAPGQTLDWLVVDPRGRVQREGAWWWLVEHDDQPILPDRERVVRGLDWRFTIASLPEPGLPMSVRGLGAGWDLIGPLRAALLDRAVVASLPSEPLLPRKLHHARKSGVLTPVEAALVLRLYALQMRMDATWALVRPAELGPGHRVCPIGYAEALLAVRWEGETRWVDPGCAVCGPFELRPHLEGAWAYGPGIDATPSPVPGTHRVEIAPDGQIAVTASGPAARLLRLALSEVPAEDRPRAIAERYGGAGAILVEAAGLALAGQPIALQVRGTPALDPLTLPEPGPDGRRWLGWVGTREVAGPAGPSTDVQLDLGAVRYARTTRDGVREETLEVVDRWVDAGTAAELAAARGAP